MGISQDELVDAIYRDNLFNVPEFHPFMELAKSVIDRAINDSNLHSRCECGKRNEYCVRSFIESELFDFWCDIAMIDKLKVIRLINNGKQEPL